MLLWHYVLAHHFFPWSNCSCHHPSQVATKRALSQNQTRISVPIDWTLPVDRVNSLLQFEPKLSSHAVLVFIRRLMPCAPFWFLDFHRLCRNTYTDTSLYIYMYTCAFVCIWYSVFLHTPHTGLCTRSKMVLQLPKPLGNDLLVDSP